MKPFAVVGHRGSRATHPENTLAAFEYAIAIGADAVELDVVMTVDSILAVTHDPVHVRFRDLPPMVPRLEQVLELAARNSITFDIEAKECGAPHEPYVALLASLLPAENVMLRSFEHDILRRFHKKRPEIPLAALTSQHTSDWVRVCAEAHATCISPWYELVSTAEVQRAHEALLIVMPWTVNNPSDWQAQVDMGVDAIITDDPARLIRFRAQCRSSTPL